MELAAPGLFGLMTTDRIENYQHRLSVDHLDQLQ